jgi:hypothetical protein
MRKAIVPVRVDSYRKKCPCLNGIFFIILTSEDFGPFLTFIKKGNFQKVVRQYSGFIGSAFVIYRSGIGIDMRSQ